MKLINSISSFHHLGRHLSSRVLASFFSSKTPTPNSPESLYSRIEIVRDPRASVTPVLDQWTQEGRPISRNQLESLIRIMKKFKRFNHALEISLWMTDRRYFLLTPDNVAVRLDLISRVQGVEHAEKYFNDISGYLKDLNAYGALLSIYVREKYVEKAEKTLQLMRERGYATTSFPYNLMINLYLQTGNHDKIGSLTTEMESMGIPQDMYTLRNRMSACVAASNIAGMKKILKQVEEVPSCVDWRDYTLASIGYLKVGLTEEALIMLRKVEEKLATKRIKFPLDYLLSLYASAGHKDRLYRIWKQNRTSFVQDSSYACMISSPEKADVKGAENLFREWESQCTLHDFRVMNQHLYDYCREGLFDKAESIALKVSEERMPYASSWNVLAKLYMEVKQMGKAVDMLKKALLVGRQGWRPDSVTLAACLEWLEDRGDVEEMEEIVRLVKNLSPLTKDIYNQLLRAYIASSRSVSEVIERMEMDGFSADEETHAILGTTPNSEPIPMLLSHCF